MVLYQTPRPSSGIQQLAMIGEWLYHSAPGATNLAIAGAAIKALPVATVVKAGLAAVGVTLKAMVFVVSSIFIC